MKLLNVFKQTGRTNSNDVKEGDGHRGGKTTRKGGGTTNEKREQLEERRGRL